MCTVVTYGSKDHYFGRTLDNDIAYGEKVVITPRNYPFIFRKVPSLKKHYAIIGIALVQDDFPLYYDAVNEHGLSIAGLNFPGNADYKEEVYGMDNLAPFELIPWILGQCRTVEDAKEMFEHLCIVNIHFSKSIPLTPLHWMISDQKKSIVVESTQKGLQIYDNPVGVMTNNPTFDIQRFHLNNYLNLSVDVPKNCWPKEVNLEVYSRGMGSMGLPGDLSSMSRFVRAAFTKIHSLSGDSEAESISQFFHILGSVTQQKGLVRLDEDVYEKTIYTSCCNMDRGIYYYKTYDSHHICAVELHNEDLEGKMLYTYPLIQEQQIFYQNRVVD